MLVGVDPNCPCKDQSGVAYPEYFLPLASDFGNQIYCVPGATYAFAWTGVTNTNIAEFLQQNASAIDLDDPSNQYVAVIGGGPYACGGFDVATEKSVPAGDPAGIGPDGEEVLHPLQISQFNRLGYYSPVKGICPGWEGDPPAEPAGSGSSLEDKLNVKGPDISCKTQICWQGTTIVSARSTSEATSPASLPMTSSSAIESCGHLYRRSTPPALLTRSTT